MLAESMALLAHMLANISMVAAPRQRATQEQKHPDWSSPDTLVEDLCSWVYSYSTEVTSLRVSTLLLSRTVAHILSNMALITWMWGHLGGMLPQVVIQ